MKEKIKLWYAEKYQSSPVEISDEEIQLLIEKNCECDQCGASIFGLCDIPNIDNDEKEVLCENCWTDEYQTYCPRCENYVMNDKINEDYFVINQDGAEVTGQKAGFYKALKQPYFTNDFFGFDGMIDGSFEFIKPIDENEDHNDCQECGNICQGCVDKYINVITD